MNVESIVVGAFQVNCYIAWSSPESAIVVDPGDDAESIRACLERNGLRVGSYMLTHGHVDHINALAELYEAEPAPVGLHEEDLTWAFAATNAMPPFYDAPRAPREVSRVLQGGESLEDGGLAYRVLSTPGHSPGSVCFYFEQESVLFCGDTLFAGSVGRTDFPGGDGRALRQSLRKLAELPGDVRVYAGHGPGTTIDVERRTNFFMRSL